jgi:hypothetical protein
VSLMGASWSDCLRSWSVSGAGFWFHWVHAWGWLRCSVGVCWGRLWRLGAGLFFLFGDWLRGLRGTVFHWIFLGCLVAVQLLEVVVCPHMIVPVEIVLFKKLLVELCLASGVLDVVPKTVECLANLFFFLLRVCRYIVEG